MTQINPEGWPRPSGYSNGVVAKGRFLAISGQIGWDEKLQLVSNDFLEQACQALSNVVDIGLVAYPVKEPKLEIVPLRKEPLTLICHPSHGFAKQKDVKLKALAGQKIIGFEPDIPTRKALDKILKEHGVEVKHVMEFDNVETVKRAVEIDAGISIVPMGTVQQEISKQTLVAVPIEDGDFYRPLAAIYKKSKVLSPAMKQFLTILKETA